MAGRLLRLYALDVFCRIIATPDRHRIFHHRTNGLEPSVPRMWPLDCGHHLPDVYLAQRCDALITMLDAEFFYDPSPCTLGLWPKTVLEIGRFQIGHNQRIYGAWLGAAGTN